MPAIAFDDWSGGLDLRTAAAVGGANTLGVYRNCYTTTGKKIQKRPCARKVATLEAGTKGLKAAGGKLNTFYATGSISHVNPLFQANKVAHPTNASTDVSAVHYAENFNQKIYAAVEYVDGTVVHHYLDGILPSFIADANCPNSRIVRKLRQKIYAGDDDGNVRFCKTTDPRDWTAANDAGFIPAANEASGSDEVTAIGDFRGDLAIAFADSMQVWDVDSDPSLNTIKDKGENLGTLHHGAMHPFANDIVVLAAAGFRSLSLQVLTDNLDESDIGSPIDKLRGEVADDDLPFSIYYPKLSQLWTINGTRAYVITYSKKAKITAWSIYDFPFTIDDAAVLRSELYLRAGNSVYVMDQAMFNDDGTSPLCEAEMFYQDEKTPGLLKQFIGFDGVVRGSPSISFKYRSDEGSLQTTFWPISGDMRPGALHPMELCATSIAPVMRHQANEDFGVDQLMLFYETLGPV